MQAINWYVQFLICRERVEQVFHRNVHSRCDECSVWVLHHHLVCGWLVKPVEHYLQ